MAWPLFLVQTKAATPFYPPPPWELQFRGDRFLLGSASRHLSPGRICRMSCNICVTATSANCNVTLRHRGISGCQDAIYACSTDPQATGDIDRADPIGRPRSRRWLPSLVFPFGFRFGLQEFARETGPWPAYKGGFRESPRSGRHTA